MHCAQKGKWSLGLMSFRLPYKSSYFCLFQTIVLISVAIWSLGGRASGALWLISGLMWCAPMAFFFSPTDSVRQQGDSEYTVSRSLLVPWLILLFVIAIGLFNATFEVAADLPLVPVEATELGSVGLFPSALVFERSLPYSLLLTGGLIQCVVLWCCLNRRLHLRILIGFMAGNAVLAGLAGAFFHFLGSKEVLSIFEADHRQFFGPFMYHNHWTAFALLGISQCLYLGLFFRREMGRDEKLRRSRPDLFWFCGVLLLSLTLPMSGARAGVLFLVLFWGIFLGGMVYLKKRKMKDSGGESGLVSSRWSIGISVVAILFFLGAGIYLSDGKLRAEWEQTTHQFGLIASGDFSEVETMRVESWGDCWRMLKARPLFGWGLGSHRDAYLLYAREKYRGPDGTVSVAKEFAHNDWMQYVAELGIFGFLALIFPVIFVSWRLCSFARLRPTLWSLAVPVFLILLLALFEFPLSNPAIWVVWIVQFVLVLKLFQISGRKNTRQPFIAHLST